jgi:hypothetical protein
MHGVVLIRLSEVHKRPPPGCIATTASRHCDSFDSLQSALFSPWAEVRTAFLRDVNTPSAIRHELNFCGVRQCRA